MNALELVKSPGFAGGCVIGLVLVSAMVLLGHFLEWWLK